MRIQQNGVDLDTESDQHKGRGQANPSEIVNILIKYVGIVATTTAHQDEAQGDESDTDEHKEIVLFLENEFLLRRLVRPVFLFFPHGIIFSLAFRLLRFPLSFAANAANVV